ncbi:sugar phosphate isomerase/epimerase family protein [Nesterenkonia flava]|uniref:Sugar phosphate isomerase/epimerase family protein n=2 Tax=Nesterenkonia flava TaxID=469799 RepID=A0ABU1FSH8_9MICC|nr:sugar phosphate isomerase/epimerase family protein [Nesterenkonia flava]MDR5711589.1 sugar phosphate isomerase/epimerase family protein [Nesterenkonia flava]
MNGIRLGAHSQMFVHDIAEDPGLVFDEVARCGLHAVEVHVADPGNFPEQEVLEAADRTGLQVVLGTALAADASTISDDPEIRSRGIAHLERCIRLASRLGASTIAGGIHSANGVFAGRGRTTEEWERSVQALQQVAPLAEEYGITLTLEPVSRYSGYFLNSAEDAVQLADAVGSTHIAVQLDTFHMNIEEADPAEAIRLVGERLKHVHVVEGNRGVPGTGQVPWRSVFAALRDIDYSGLLVYEHFPVTLPTMATRTHTWRSLASSQDVCVYGTENLRRAAREAGFLEEDK